MRTHGEVQAAIDAGKQLQAPTREDWKDISPEYAQGCTPGELRIKPEPPKRLECWKLSGNRGYMEMIPMDPNSIPLREYRKGDLTREEVEEKLRICDESAQLTPRGVRRIFLDETE